MSKSRYLGCIEIGSFSGFFCSTPMVTLLVFTGLATLRNVHKLSCFITCSFGKIWFQVLWRIIYHYRTCIPFSWTCKKCRVETHCPWPRLLAVTKKQKHFEWFSWEGSKLCRLPETDYIHLSVISPWSSTVRHQKTAWIIPKLQLLWSFERTVSVHPEFSSRASYRVFSFNVGKSDGCRDRMIISVDRRI